MSLTQRREVKTEMFQETTLHPALADMVNPPEKYTPEVDE